MHLQAEFPFQECASIDAVGHIATVEVGIHSGCDLRFLPDQRVDAGHWLPMELHQARLAARIDEPEGVDAEALHRSVRPRDPPVAHRPQHHVGRLGVQRHEVPERVVRGLGLRDLAIRVRLGGVDDVGELDPVLDEEDRHVIADQVEVALVGVELHREAADIADGVGRAARSGDGREPHEHIGRPTARQEAGLRHRRRRPVGLEHAVSGGAAGMDHSFRNPFVVEVGDLLAQVEVLEQRRPSIAGLERVIGVGQPQHLGPSSGRCSGPAQTRSSDMPPTTGRTRPAPLGGWRAQRSGRTSCGAALRLQAVGRVESRRWLRRTG